MRKHIFTLLFIIIGTFAYSNNSIKNTSANKTNAINIRMDSLSSNINIRIDSLDAIINHLNKKSDNTNQSIEDIYKQIESISYCVNVQKDLISQEQSVIENSMSSINTLLTIISIVLSAGGIFLGWYVNRKEKNMQVLLSKVEENKADVEKLEEKTLKTKKEIENLNEDITNDIEGLYDKLRKEETKSLIQRLVYEPQDISNICNLLLARTIDATNFKYLITAYRNYKASYSYNDNKSILVGLSPKQEYLVLFFQHFCGQAISHDLVRDDLIKFFPDAFRCAFKSDVINSTHSFITCINKDDNLDKINILYDYLYALINSKHKDCKEAYEIIISKYNNDSELQMTCKNLVDKKIEIPPHMNDLLQMRFSDDELFLKSIKSKNKLSDNTK